MFAVARFSIHINDVGLLQRRTEKIFDHKQNRLAEPPKTELGGLTPLQFASSESAHALVKDALERINQGYAY
jgi:hypothetical protein